VKTKFVGPVLLWLLMNTSVLFAQEVPDLFQGYEGEWNHVSGQLIALAEATPPDKPAWRPASAPPVKCMSHRTSKFPDAETHRIQNAL
jgi:hypothetical protein